MAIYHCSIKIISRGKGKSTAAYRSGKKLTNEYDGVTHDYTRKSGISHTEILLPAHAPPEFSDRSTLWNAVEKIEKAKNSQLARELVVALPVELKSDEWIEMLRDFISENCVSKGMCADFSIHDTDGHNPHAHILLTMRPLDENGKWQAKTQKEYLCKRGDEERGFTAAEFNAAQTDGWEKQYQYKVGKKKIYMTPSEAEAQDLERVSKNPKSTRFGRQNPICAKWNSKEQILTFRKAWEEEVNKSLEQKHIDARIDCRSFADRGIDEQPTIHEGVTARVMEKCGFVSDRCELNRQIRKDNILLRQLKALVKSLTDVVENAVSIIAEKIEKYRERAIFSLRNSQPAEKMKANIDDFKATVADISPEDMPAVQEERSNFRDTMKSLWTKIQQQYGYRSNYDLLKAAKDEIDMELGEYQPHIRKSIRKDLEQKRQQADEQQSRRNRRDEWER